MRVWANRRRPQRSMLLIGRDASLAGIAYCLFFLMGGLVIARNWLPGHRPLVRWYIGASIGLLLMMWLPVLWAYAVAFTVTAHLLAALTLFLLTLLTYLTREHRPRVRFSEEDRRMLRAVLLVVVPLTLLAGVLEYTHSIRPAADGTYHVGQSTYGDLSLHLAVTTSIVHAKFPLANSLMVGATMAYPYLADSFAATLYLLGMTLPGAMSVSGILMCAMVFLGYALLVAQLCRKRGTVVLATLLLFMNGGLGFFYTLGGSVQNGVVTTVWDNLRNVMQGYYQTPTNQPDPNNLRWVNMVCDMLVPQRGILGGWTMLMPALLLLLPPLARRRRPFARAMILAGIIAGGLPLLHTHSFLALALCSIGFMGYALFTAPYGRRKEAFAPFLLYGGIAAVLALPQLINFTFVQVSGSDHFLRYQFNWCNNRGGHGLVDGYFWFYIKNIGLPYLLIILALFTRRTGDLRIEADHAAARTDGLYEPDADPYAPPANVLDDVYASIHKADAAQNAEEDAAKPEMDDVLQTCAADVGMAEFVSPPTVSLGQSPARIAALAVEAEDAQLNTPVRASVFAHDMPAYGENRMLAKDEMQTIDVKGPYLRPLSPDKLRAASFSPDDSDRVGVMRAVTGAAGDDPSHRPLVEEIFHATYRSAEVAAADAVEHAKRFTPGQPETCFAEHPHPRDWVRQNRLIAVGAFVILLVAEQVIFQPNEYDNNKLIYVWFLLCLPMAADFGLDVFHRLRGIGARWLIAVLLGITLFLSAGLTVARELVSDYQAYSKADIAVAEHVKQNTPEHSVFLTGTQHLNPVASLAGRTLVCGSDLYLYYHGFDTTLRKQEVQAFYEDPAAHLAMLTLYGVRYVYVSSYERSDYAVDEVALHALFTPVYESENGEIVIYAVPQSTLSTTPKTQTVPSATPDPALNPAIGG